jgi:hypothetical protein
MNLLSLSNVRINFGFFDDQPSNRFVQKMREQEAIQEVRQALNSWEYSRAIGDR